MAKHLLVFVGGAMSRQGRTPAGSLSLMLTLTSPYSLSPAHQPSALLFTSSANSTNEAIEHAQAPHRQHSPWRISRACPEVLLMIAEQLRLSLVE